MNRSAAVMVDTSVAVPMLVRNHAAHGSVWSAIGRREPHLTGHSLAETFAVLTRLPGDARVAAADAVRLIDDIFAAPALLSEQSGASVHQVFSTIGVLGGAVYDGLVALAAREHRLTLLTRDQRALSTYGRVGAATEVVPDV